MKVAFQVACSSQCGDRVKRYVNDISPLYGITTEKIAKKFNVACDDLRPTIVDFYISVIKDYIIWDDEEKTTIELKIILIMISKLERFYCNK